MNGGDIGTYGAHERCFHANGDFHRSIGLSQGSRERKTALKQPSRLASLLPALRGELPALPGSIWQLHWHDVLWYSPHTH